MEYCLTRFGKIDFDLNTYISAVNDKYLAEIITDCFNNMHKNEIAQINKLKQQARKLQEERIAIKQLKNSKSYRIGHMIIYPLSISLLIISLGYY